MAQFQKEKASFFASAVIEDITLGELLDTRSQARISQGVVLIIVHATELENTSKILVTVTGLGSEHAFCEYDRNNVKFVSHKDGAVYWFQNYSWDPSKQLIGISNSTKVLSYFLTLFYLNQTVTTKHF